MGLPYYYYTAVITIHTIIEGKNVKTSTQYQLNLYNQRLV